LICVKLAGTWQVSDAGKNDWIAATVPGWIHIDLPKAGKIPDPFYRDNEQAVKWVGETDWKYKRAFQVSGELLQRDRVLLRCTRVVGVALFERLRCQLFGQLHPHRPWIAQNDHAETGSNHDAARVREGFTNSQSLSHLPNLINI
jgi:hypothetical protein